MFRAEILWFKQGPILKIEGKLAGNWAEQARALVIKEVIPKGMIVDLTEVSYVDCLGEQLLKWLGAVGATFLTGNVYVAHICERLCLPLLESVTPQRTRSESTSEELLR